MLFRSRTIAEYWRSEALAALAPHLPAEQQPAVYTDALAAARTIDSEYWRSRALAALAPHLPPLLLADALAAARAIKDGRAKSEALAALAPHLPPALLADALAAARAIRSDRNRARALAALAPHLPAEQQPAVYADALAAAQAIADEDWRSEALQALAPHLAATPALDDQFAPTLRILAQRGRPALLGDLRALQPWLAALAKRRRQSTMLAALATAISETGRCWP